MSRKHIKHNIQEAIKQEAKGLQALSTRVDDQFVMATYAIIDATKAGAKVVLTGVGKSGHIATKVAATMRSLGTSAIFLDPTAAAHGDMGIIGKDDIILAFSRSGTASELGPIMNWATLHGNNVVLVTESLRGGWTTCATWLIILPKVAEAWGHAPTTSTTMQMAVGDAIAVAAAKHRGMKVEDFRRTHPGGALGQRKSPHEAG